MAWSKSAGTVSVADILSVATAARIVGNWSEALAKAKPF